MPRKNGKNSTNARANNPGARKAGGKKAKAKRAKSPRCGECGRTIRVPEGWSAGPAVRRHYWSKHREIMLGKRGSK